jgi:hypothetical protein
VAAAEGVAGLLVEHVLEEAGVDLAEPLGRAAADEVADHLAAVLAADAGDDGGDGIRVVPVGRGTVL